MFINNGTTLSDDIDSKKSRQSELREKSGLIDCRRAIHVFYDENDPFNCKVIQINISVTQGTHVMFDKTFMNRSNGTLSFIAVYTYDCKLNNSFKEIREKFINGSLSIISVKRNDRETDYTNMYTRNEFAQLYSKSFSNYRLTSNIDSRSLIHPKYYSQEHEYNDTGDCNFEGIVDSISSLYIQGSEIVDDITEIYLQDPSMFETVRDRLNNLVSMDRIRTNGIIDSASETITEMNYILGCDSLVNGGIFVYDSEADAMNVKDTMLMCKDYIDKQSAVTELETFMASLEGIGKAIQRQHGSIRLMYSPSLLGSKCRVIYRDYNNIVSDSGMKNSLSSKDSSHEITETIGEFIEHDDSLFTHEQVLEDIRYPELQKQKIISYFE